MADTPLIDFLSPEDLAADLHRDAAQVIGAFVETSFSALEEKAIPLTETQRAVIVEELVCGASDLPAAFERTITRALEARAEVRRNREGGDF